MVCRRRASEAKRVEKMVRGNRAGYALERRGWKENVWRWAGERDGWMNLVATNGRPYPATEQSVLGSFAEAGRAGETKGTKAPGNLDDDETKSAEDSANWCQSR